MTKISDLVHFRDDLFFGGAVQIDWFHTRPEERDKAAAHFVFHGPNYYGVDTQDRSEAGDYSRIDTVSLTRQLIDCVEPEKNGAHFLGLAIAGYGAGKSHYGLTLAQLFSDPESPISQKILENLAAADKEMGKEIRGRLEAWQRPVLVIPINGMEDFNLADELSRQVMIRLRNDGLDTEVIEELRPRFKDARRYVELNFNRFPEEFAKAFGESVTADAILSALNDHDEEFFQKVNDIYEYLNGNPIPVSGAESPRVLIETLCTHYCNPKGPFSSLLILFDEFGRYVEFAGARPYIAGDAAIQQIFEGVQNQADRCFMLCTVQYELNTYISRVSHENRDAIKRYLSRYNVARKFFLSSNLETLFAHLVEKKDEKLLEELLFDNAPENHWESLRRRIQEWFPKAGEQAVWEDFSLFRKTVVKGSWPLHPLAVLFLSSLGNDLQERSSVSFIKAAMDRHKKKKLPETDIPWTIPATGLFRGSGAGKDPLLEELLGGERFGMGGSAVQAYLSVVEKYGKDLTDNHQNILRSVLIAAKMGLKSGTEADARAAFAELSGLPPKSVQTGIQKLIQDFNVLEWEPKFGRYEIIRDALPKSEFIRLLREKVKEIETERIEKLFSLHIRKWTKLPQLEGLDPEFNLVKQVTTTEWKYTGICSNLSMLASDMEMAIAQCRGAVMTDQPRGALIFVYVPAGEKITSVEKNVGKTVEKGVGHDPERPVSLLISLIHDPDDRIAQLLSERWIVEEGLGKEEQGRFKNFIDDHKGNLEVLLKEAVEAALKARRYVFPPLPPGKKIEPSRLKSTAFALFERIYPQVPEFPFDGFHAAKGNAVKDCREMTAALFTGALDYEWVQASKIKTQNRVNSVLVNSWKAFGKDGKIAESPGNPLLKKLAQGFDKALAQEKEIHLGEMFDLLTAPPYGMNISSAGLFMGVFISPRLKRTALMLDDTPVSPADWLSNALPGPYHLDRKVLDRTAIIHVETDQWEALLDRWASEQTHAGRVAFGIEAEELMQHTPLPEGLLRERWQHLAEKAHHSRNELEKLEDFIEKRKGYLEKAIQKEDAGNASRSGSEAAAFENRMNKEAHCWQEKEIKGVVQVKELAVEAVQRLFDVWLPQQRILKAQQIGEFRHKMLDQIGGNLKALGLTDLRKRLEAHVLSNISNIENLQKVSYIVDEAKAFLSGRKVSGHSKVGELTEWIETGQRLTKTLEKAKSKNLPEINTLSEQVTAFISDCKKQRTAQRDRHNGLMYRSFATIGEIKSMRTEALELKTIFADQEIELSELSRMEERLAGLETDFSGWNDLSVPTDTLKKRISERIEAIKAAEEDDEELPEWRDTEKIYKGFLEHLLKERKTRSGEWLEMVFPSSTDPEKLNAGECRKRLSEMASVPPYVTEADREKLESLQKALENRLSDLWLAENYRTPASIEAMPAERCQKLLSASNALPEYLTPENREKIAEMRKHAEKRLDDLEVEGLLARYRELSFELQKAFLRVAVKEFKALQNGSGSLD